MRETAAVCIVFGAIGFALTANISPLVFAAGVVISGTVAIAAWAYRAWGGRDPFGKRVKCDHCNTLLAHDVYPRRRPVELEVALTLKDVLDEDDPMRAVHKSVARHFRRAGLGAPRPPWHWARAWLSAHLSPEFKARVRRVLARIPGGAR